MDFQESSARYTAIYDGYTALSRIMPDFYHGGVLYAEDLEPIIQSVFKCSGADDLTDTEAEQIYDSYLKGIHECLRSRLSTQIDLYHATLLQHVHLKRQTASAFMSDQIDIAKQFGLIALDEEIQKTIRQINTNWPDPADLKDKWDAVKAEIAAMRIDVGRAQQAIDTARMFEIGCKADLDTAENCLRFCHYDLAALYLATSSPNFKHKIAGDLEVFVIYEQVRERVFDFSGEGSDSILAAHDHLMDAYKALHPEEHEIWDQGYGFDD